MPRSPWWTLACVCAGAVGLFAQTAQLPSRPGAPVGGSAGVVSQPGPSGQAAPATGTGVIRGHVLRSADKSPVPRARVTVRGGTNPAGVAATTADDTGRFELKDVPPGRYTVGATRTGFVDALFGATHPGQPGQTIEIKDGDTLQGIDLHLSAAGVISGIILDDVGEPMVQVAVEALQSKYSQGTRQLVASVRAVTDDRGEYRLFGLSPGAYLIRATVSSRSTPTALGVAAIVSSPGAMSTFYPGTADAGAAKTVRAEAGSETSGVTFPVAPSRRTKITGVIRSAEGGVPSAATGLSIRVAFLSDVGASTSSYTPKADGSFSVPAGPGRYSLTVQRSIGSEGAIASVTVADADVFVPMTLRQGSTARGRVVGDNGMPPESLEPGAVRIAPESPDVPLTLNSSVVQDDWTFETTGLLGPKRLRVTVPREWTVKSIQSGSRDVTDVGLDFSGKDINDIVIRLTQQTTQVSGVVTDARGRRVPDATVVVFAEDADRWQPRSRFIRATRPDQDGRFMVDRLPATRYLAVALDYLEAGEETNPETLDKLRRLAKPITVRDGTVTAIDLRVEEAP